ncbi:MAG TPA: head maturation protease, ClpP-related [Micromonosporaceae bacterium]|nr:head maturation protease, ClpP-related [Micromonosporaceae bacterium]
MNQQWLKLARPVAELRRGRTDWYRIENATSNGRAEVYIYDEIGYFGVTAADFAREVNALNVEAIDLHLSSPGGSAFEGVAIYNSLLHHRATVTSYVDSLAASAASVIAMAGDRIIMRTGSQLMIHEASGMGIGKADDMRELADLLDKTSGSIADIYAERRGGTAAKWRKAMKNETWYDAQEAVRAGLADEVSGASDESQNSWDLSIFNYAGRNHAPAPIDDVDPFRVDAEELRRALQEAFQ